MAEREAVLALATEIVAAHVSNNATTPNERFCQILRPAALVTLPYRLPVSDGRQ